MTLDKNLCTFEFLSLERSKHTDFYFNLKISNWPILTKMVTMASVAKPCQSIYQTLRLDETKLLSYFRVSIIAMCFELLT